jgi:hypothetical protein
MMLASVAQDRQSAGRQGLPIVGLIPILGRLFTAPTRDNFQTDIVIAVTPRVLRAPAVTPRDEELRPSGTLSSPTIGTLEAMIQETDREDALAAARRIPKNVQVQLPDASPEQATYVPAPKALMSNEAATEAPAANAANLTVANTSNTNAASANSLIKSIAVDAAVGTSPVPQPASASAQPLATAIQTTTGPVSATALSQDLKPGESRLVNFSWLMSSKQSASIQRDPSLEKLDLDDVPPPMAVKTQEAPAATPAVTGPINTEAELRLMPERTAMRVGERQRVALALTASEPLGATIVKLRFDPRVIAVRGVSQGALLSGVPANMQPTLMQSIDPSGALLLSIQTPVSAPLKTGMNIILFVEVEAVADGQSELGFEKELVRLSAADGRTVLARFVPVSIAVGK